MLIKNYLIGIILFSIIIMASVFAVTEMSHSYGVSVDTDFNSTYNSISGMEQSSKDLQGSLEGGSITPGTFQIVFSGIGNFFKLIFKFITLPVTMMDHAYKDLGIPDSARWIITAISTIIVIMIIFAIASAVTKKEI